MIEPKGEFEGRMGREGAVQHMSKNIYSQYIHLQVHVPGIVIVIFHKFGIFRNHGGLYRFERKFNKNHRER